MPGHFILLLAIFSLFFKQILQQLKPAVEMQSAQWFWEPIECFWLNLGFKIYKRKSPVNVHKFLRLRADFMASNAHAKCTCTCTSLNKHELEIDAKITIRDIGMKRVNHMYENQLKKAPSLLPFILFIHPRATLKGCAMRANVHPSISHALSHAGEWTGDPLVQISTRGFHAFSQKCDYEGQDQYPLNLDFKQQHQS